MDVVLRHQRDGDAVPPWSATKNQQAGILKRLYKQPRMEIVLRKVRRLPARAVRPTLWM